MRRDIGTEEEEGGRERRREREGRRRREEGRKEKGGGLEGVGWQGGTELVTVGQCVSARMNPGLSVEPRAPGGHARQASFLQMPTAPRPSWDVGLGDFDLNSAFHQLL